ncbi:Olfactory Receptor 7G2 [Manis pentadactyla]|nr:Olfactory Receptor 7G2 [Manis pentadactyla]
MYVASGETDLTPLPSTSTKVQVILRHANVWAPCSTRGLGVLHSHLCFFETRNDSGGNAMSSLTFSSDSELGTGFQTRFNDKEPRNHTDVSEFLFLGLTEDPELQPLLFGLFLSMYLVTILGNLLIILAISSDPHLQSPMYFFLSNLSLADIGLSTIMIPKMLLKIQAQNQHISYSGCITQIGFVMFFGGCESCLLAPMACDR